MLSAVHQRLIRIVLLYNQHGGQIIKSAVFKGYNMGDKQILLNNIDKVHTTQMGAYRIKKNLNLDNIDVVAFCRNLILDENCRIYKQGKNWYCEIDDIKITVNSYSYTIITAHKCTLRLPRRPR